MVLFEFILTYHDGSLITWMLKSVKCAVYWSVLYKGSLKYPNKPCCTVGYGYFRQK